MSIPQPLQSVKRRSRELIIRQIRLALRMRRLALHLACTDAAAQLRGHVAGLAFVREHVLDDPETVVDVIDTSLAELDRHLTHLERRVRHG